MKSSLMKLNYVSTFLGKGQEDIVMFIYADLTTTSVHAKVYVEYFYNDLKYYE